MNFTITTPCKINKNPINTFKLYVEFDDGESLKIYTRDTEYITKLITMYDTYKKNLRNDWNSYCNPEQEDVISYHDEVELDSEDFYGNTWSKSNEYDCQARFDSYTLTYYNEECIEHDVIIS